MSPETGTEEIMTGEGKRQNMEPRWRYVGKEEKVDREGGKRDDRERGGE